MKIKFKSILTLISLFSASFLIAQDDLDSYQGSDDMIIQELSNYKKDNYNERFNEIGNSVLAQLNERMKNRPDSVWLYIQRGWLYISMGQLDNAVADFKKSIQMSPSSSAYMGLGMAYNNMGKTKLANEAYLKALKIKPTYPGYDGPLLYDGESIGADTD
ncbi:MAG: tetratricopeptide repeat protein [Lentisphaerota bacterium]